jgi:hypothetical protein
MEITIVVFLVIMLCSAVGYQWHLLRTSRGYSIVETETTGSSERQLFGVISKTTSLDFYLRNPSNPITQLHDLQHTIQICPCELAPCKILTVLRECDPFTAVSQIQLYVA